MSAARPAHDLKVRLSQRPTRRPPALESRASGIHSVEDVGNRLMGKLGAAFERGDFLGALPLVTRILDRRRVPVVIALPSALGNYALDPQLAFVLSLIDGVAPIEQLVDLSGLTMLEVLRLLGQLVEKQVVSLVDDAPPNDA